MPIPTTYTEKQLAEFMHLTLGKVAEALGLHFGPEDAGDYAVAVENTLLAYGADDIATISGTESIRKLRALASVCAWRYAVTNFAALYDFSADGASYSRSQLFAQAKESLDLAEDQAVPYAASYAAKIVPVDHKHDPYRVRPEEENSL
jgi:hypothetical protein